MTFIMEELDIALIKKRSITGVFSLVSRTFIIQIIGQLVSLLLTIYLTKGDYGLFFLVSNVIVFLGYFSDIGLAAALIQKKEEVTPEDLKTTFTIQQGLVTFLVLLGLGISPWVAKVYSLDIIGTHLYQALLIAFFLSSLKTIPSILLERRLEFSKLVIPEIVETILFNVTVLVLAIKGFGVQSFIYAVLLRGISGLIVIYIISPWKLQIGFSKSSAKKLLAFGLPFQANSFLALIKDNVLILYLGAILSKESLGFIGVAQKWAFLPLRLVMDNVIRITFPSFSRMAGHPETLGKAIEKTLFAIALLIFPSVTGLVILMPHFMTIFPKYQKWEPALFSLIFFGFNAVFSSISTPLTNALNAIGKIKVTLGLMVFWTVATWILTPLLVMWYGFNGVAMASALVSASVVGVVIIIKKYIQFTILPLVIPPFVATVVMGVSLLFLSPLITNFFMFFGVILLAGGIYAGMIMLIARQAVLSDIQLIRENLKK
ncbi:lipopolysaccharide biosynthesis protein [soil metagenome]